MNRFTIFAISAVLAGVALGAARARHADGRPEHCKEEVVELCPEIGAGGGSGATDCLRRNLRLGNFSRECREVARHRFPDVCVNEAKSLCKGIKPDDPEFVPCLRSNWDDLSRRCRTSFVGWFRVSEEWKAQAQDACSDDGELCPGVSRGFSNWWLCLKEHENRLSSYCKAFVKAQPKSTPIAQDHVGEKREHRPGDYRL